MRAGRSPPSPPAARSISRPGPKRSPRTTPCCAPRRGRGRCGGRRRWSSDERRRMNKVVARLSFVLVALLVCCTGARADPIADFYRGKNIRMLVGYGPGGGYDLYARLVAEFLPRHLPGNPTIVTENMPGAGSLVAAKYLAEVAPKDGPVLGSLAQTLALDSAVD